MRKKIALWIGGVGAVLVCTSGVFLGTGASALYAAVDPYVALQEEPSHPTEDPTPVAVDTPTATPEPTTTGRQAPYVEFSFDDVTLDEMIATIPQSFSDEEKADSKIWLTQQSIEWKCMKDQGFDIAFSPYWLSGVKIHTRAETEAAWNPTDDMIAENLARSGDTGAGADYHWEDAGCDGLAVHETGMDGQH